MRHVVVVGSGASGVHFALTLLRKNYRVTMVDVGRSARKSPLPEANFDSLKEQLADPAEYFLGADFSGVLLPDAKVEYYGIPPHKQYIFDLPPNFGFSATGFAPLFSFAQGGLAEAWTGGCYPFNDAELAQFPFRYESLGPFYDEVARRIGITGASDDLAAFVPVHGHLLDPLRLDQHSQVLLDAYARKRDKLNRGLGCYVGRSRVATLSRDLEGRKACEYLGRCLWGCPSESLYTPAQTLRECQQHPNFTYLGGVEAQYVTLNGARRATGLVVLPVEGGQPSTIEADAIALAAGTLCSTKIVLRSEYEHSGRIVRLNGLMDNRQVLVPFVNLRMLGSAVSADTYQYHLIGMGFAMDSPAEYVHCLITTLKTALFHPIIEKLPFDTRTATAIVRATRSALGIVNVNLHDNRRTENYVTLMPSESGVAPTQLAIRYQPSADEPARLRAALRRVGRALRALGCIVAPGMSYVRPMGASVHYAGTLPMSREPAPWTTDENCRSRDFENVYLVDGSTFPFLPAKNLTFTLMANAVRVAEQAF
jgi:choline dehydrogenase-like flavoprotein